MLLEIVNGNLNYRIQFAANNTYFNEVAEKMQVAAYTNPFLTIDKIQATSADEPAILIAKVQDYILNHLEETLPSTKELSQMFRTNVFTLKENFRNLLKTSIYQYYNMSDKIKEKEKKAKKKAKEKAKKKLKEKKAKKKAKKK
jgi:uncharacterized protein YcaQ